jgi:quercetin dioxygenase-like cupin family protein
MEFFVRPGGFVAAEHVHPKQEERFEIRNGVARFRIRGDERDGHIGDAVVVPPSTRHVWWNAGDDELRMIVEIRPALRFESFQSVVRARGGR